jgi:hypothetical protein
MSREAIVAEFVDKLKSQRTVKFGKIQRDPIIPEELPKTGFPAVYVETSDTDIIDLSFGNNRDAVMEIALVTYVAGKERDKQRNALIGATEATIMADRSLSGKARDCALTRIESVTTGEAEPYASCRMVFTVKYCYSLN